MALQHFAVVPLVAGAAIAVMAVPSDADAARADSHLRALGSWRMEVRRDRFSDNVTCRLRTRDKRAEFRGGAVGFHFDRDRDVGAAVYRLDGGAPRRWRDDLPLLVRRGTPIDAGGLANPSAGIVWIPYERLGDVNTVAIQAAPGRRPRTFRLRGLAGMLQAAADRGCRRDAGFFA